MFVAVAVVDRTFKAESLELRDVGISPATADQDALIILACITGNSSLEHLRESLLSPIHVNLSLGMKV